MNTEQLRAEFEAEYAQAFSFAASKSGKFDRDECGDYTDVRVLVGWRMYQAGRAALQSQPNTGELPRQSREAVLRAMGRNYTPGKHTWDSLDSDACAKGADEIRQLRAALALQSQDREASVMDAIQRLPRYNFGYVSDDWGMVRQPGAIRKDNGRFLRVDDVMAAIDHTRRVEGVGNEYHE